METPKLSFTFLKQKRQILPSPKIQEPTSHPEAREYITSIEDKIIHSEKPKEQQLVIPLIHSKNGIRHRIRAMHKDVSALDPLTERAIRELKREADLSDEEHSRGPVSIPVKKSLSSEEQVDEINYDAVPVESFGLAVLTGMGFDPKQLKADSGQPVGPIRPKGLGLGANPHAVQAAIEDSKKSNEKLSWCPGARCQVVLGKHKGLYGIVNGLDGDTGRIIVKLTISKEVVPILQPMLRLVPEKEYAKYANCLNQQEVDEYKANEANHPLNDDADSAMNESSHKQGQHPTPTTQKSWVRPNLLVKFLDKYYKNGKYYKEKVVVTSVESDRCTCRTPSGRLIEDVNPKYLQTVVPKENNVMVMILHGPRTGEMAKLVDQHPKFNEVDLRTRAGTMIQLTYDQVCCVARTQS